MELHLINNFIFKHDASRYAAIETTKAELAGLGNFERGYYVRLVKGPIVDLVVIRLLGRL